MKLPVFELVENTVALLRDLRPELEMKAAQLDAYFAIVFADHCESLVAINTRVKGEDSLKEKILRKNLYKRYSYPEAILMNLSDLIGIRVECRFLADENNLSRTLQEKFTQKAEDGYYYCPDNPDIRLEMEEMQPQMQTNGFKIYRIDGMLGPVGQAVRFELQIKALVHVFWAEVEHEIIYKNNSYMLMDAFMKELLSLAYANLSLVDNQLYLIYDQIQKQTEPVQNYIKAGAVHNLFAKAISDMFYLKMRQNLGFTLNFRHSCDILSRYLLERQSKMMLQSGAKTMMDMLARVNKLITMEIDFECPIVLEQEFSSQIPFMNILADHMISQLNVDYEWNLLFRMLFALEPGSNIEDFTNLLTMLYERLGDHELYAEIYEAWPEESANSFREWLLVNAAHQMVADGSIRIIYDSSLNTICERIQNVVGAYASADPPEKLPRVMLWNEADLLLEP